MKSKIFLFCIISSICVIITAGNEKTAEAANRLRRESQNRRTSSQGSNSSGEFAQSLTQAPRASHPRAGSQSPTRASATNNGAATPHPRPLNDRPRSGRAGAAVQVTNSPRSRALTPVSPVIPATAQEQEYIQPRDSEVHDAAVIAAAVSARRNSTARPSTPSAQYTIYCCVLS